MKIQIEEKKPLDVPREWCPFDGAKFLIAGSSKPAFGRKMEVFATKLGQEMNGHRLITDESTQRIPLEYNKAHSDLILDWEGVADPDGNPIKYSTDMAETLCTMAVNSETKEGLSASLVMFIAEQSERIQKAADQIKAETLGKSENSTAGPNSTAKQKPQNTTSNSKP